MQALKFEAKLPSGCADLIDTALTNPIGAGNLAFSLAYSRQRNDAESTYPTYSSRIHKSGKEYFTLVEQRTRHTNRTPSTHHEKGKELRRGTRQGQSRYTQ